VREAPLNSHRHPDCRSIIQALVAAIRFKRANASSSAQSVTGSASSALRPLACPDGKPHKKMLVRVDSGVRLQVLD
jgi:hypothetical protein